MNKLTKFSFILLQIASLLLIVVYLIAVITVGAAGHNVWSAVTFFCVVSFALVLAFLLLIFQRKPTRIVRTLLLFILVPIEVLLCFYIVMIFRDGLVDGALLIAFIFGLFVSAAAVVIRTLFKWRF
ncbi:hypothetical protein DQQ10_07160 [Pseudochryseolinea flava]|uniref:Uncharacterized protein n=1 Tax=Pseudochryseolinea flava TaxID=2059302 RepID=A0A364Y674_9BACT|nr:hypothetical protein DQQ10_07160 [Pseudochryseolinea flava]